jgi:acid stress-induced BolA-like protein IbaG/YrbA
MADLAEVKRLIEDALPGSRVSVTDLTGGGDHLAVVVIASQFLGRGLVDQHRMIHAALKHKMAPVSAEIHALQIKTGIPES